MALKTDIEQLDGGRKLPLVEDFYTIQGEGFHAGKPAYFIRLGGCDVGCRWCDAKYTWNPRLYPPTDVRTVIDRATACPAQAIVITGGEPLLYPLGVLTETLHAKGLEKMCIRDSAYIDPQKCKLCRKCVNECPTGAIVLAGMDPLPKVPKAPAAPKASPAAKEASAGVPTAPDAGATPAVSAAETPKAE